MIASINSAERTGSDIKSARVLAKDSSSEFGSAETADMIGVGDVVGGLTGSIPFRMARDIESTCGLERRIRLRFALSLLLIYQ